MNRYEATLPNVLARIGAWMRGILRLYRRPLLVVGTATATLALAVSAGQAPEPAPVALAR